MINMESVYNYVGKKITFKAKWDHDVNEGLLVSIDKNYLKDMVLQVQSNAKFTNVLYKELIELEEKTQ